MVKNLPPNALLAGLFLNFPPSPQGVKSFLNSKQSTLLQPEPARLVQQQQQQAPQQELSAEAPQPLFKQPTKGLKEQSTEDTFRLRLEQTSSGSLADFRKALL